MVMAVSGILGSIGRGALVDSQVMVLRIRRWDGSGEGGGEHGSERT